jgi:nitroimidazol reductase NimA-like FMN-containing flavoprotein (pyridoxamine 5'-phosphate oxidase superfamily)
MVIREMSKDECLRVLAGARLARLACTRENQPYVVPVYLAYHESSSDGACLYGFTTLGQKVEWMRANPLVCVEVDEIAAHDRWVSVIVLGRYEELPETTECDDGRLAERLRAYQALKTQAVWWEPGCTARASRAHRDLAQPYTPIYYKVRIDHITGHEATPDACEAISSGATAPPAGRLGWLRKALTRVFGGRSTYAGPAS